MYPISVAVRDAFASGAMQYARITVSINGQQTVVQNDKIRQGGLIINRYSATSDTVSVGSCVAAEMTLVLDNYSGEFDNVADWKGEEAFVEVGIKVGNTTTYVPMGYFTFDSVTFGRSDVTLTALDRLIRFEKVIGTLTFPMTLTALLNACCTACGVTLAAGSLTNGSYTVSALPEEARTYRDLLRWIFEIAGSCAYINRSGALAFAWYASAAFDITVANRKASTLDKQSVVITGVEITDGDDVYTSGVSDRMIRINNNPLLKASQQLIADSLYQKCGGLTYVPFTATIVPSPQLFILDMPTFYLADGVTTVPVAITEITYRLNGYTEIAGTGGKGVYPHGYGLSEAILNASNMKGGTLPPDRIGDSAITGMKIAAQAVTEGKIAANAVTEGKIAANAVVADKIASGAVSTDKLAANAVVAGKIAAGAVTADKISVSDLFSLNATIGNWEITQNALRKIVTIGEYDYQIILYAPSSPQLTTSAIAIQRRATGTSDAWASVTRMTFAGKLISNDAEITGVVNSGSGSIGGWTISQTGLSKVITSGQYDYQVILYTPSNATATSTAIAVQRRATGTSDAWASVTRITYGGKLISSDAEITGTVNSGTGSIGGWTIGQNAISKSQTVSGTTYTAGMYAPSSVTGDSAAFKVQKGSDTLSMNYDATITGETTSGSLHNKIRLNPNSVEAETDYVNPDNNTNRHSTMFLSGNELSIEDDFKIDSTTYGDPRAEASLKAQNAAAGLSLLSEDDNNGDLNEGSIDAWTHGYGDTIISLFEYDGTEERGNGLGIRPSMITGQTVYAPQGEGRGSFEIKMSPADNHPLIELDYTDSNSDEHIVELDTENGLSIDNTSYTNYDSGTATRNTTNTTGGTCEYWQIGRIVVVSFRQLVPAVTTADAVLFTGLPDAVANTSFPAIATTARGAGRLYVDTSGRIKIGGNMNTAGTYLGNFTYVSA